MNTRPSAEETLMDKRVPVVAGAVTLVVLAAALLLWLSKTGPAFAEVEGQVTLDGKPLPWVEVVFMPDSARGKGLPGSSSVTDAEGRYRLGTLKGQSGAAVGTHRVVLFEARPDPDPEYKKKHPSWDKAPPRVHPFYSQVVSTPFNNIEVKSGKQVLNFSLKAKPEPGKQ